MRFSVGFQSDVGMRRSQNQDNGRILPELGLFIVADGMGGHRGGETASAIAVESVTRCIQSRLPQVAERPEAVLTESILAANRSILEEAKRDPELQGMGTTLTVLLFSGRKLYIGQVGDSRCYFATPGAIWQLTRDHSLVQEKLRAGLITREQVKTDRLKNVITRSVGFEENIEIDVFRKEVRPGDVYLACSDGLSGMVSDDEILGVLEAHSFGHSDEENAAKALIDLANRHGGEDNVTVMITQVQEN